MENFQDQLHSPISYLRRQTNLEAYMGTVCSTTSIKRWLSLGFVCSWLIKNRRKIMGYLNEKTLDIGPVKSWWVSMQMIGDVMVAVNQCFKSFQGTQTFLEDQNMRLEKIVQDIKIMLGVVSQPSDVDILTAVMENNLVLYHSSTVVYRSELPSFAQDLGSFVCSNVDELDQHLRDDV